ncbi:MAG TPA: urate hydroxylase PuuD [Pyrinomonadaceae bacterium]
MFIESNAHLPMGLAMLQDVMDVVHGPGNMTGLVKAILRWSHFVAGIAWIGMLYFFNLVNVPLQKELDADTKKKVNPGLLSRALWYFRWGAVVTVLAGLTYYAMYILAVEAKGAGVGTWSTLGIWLLIVLVTYAILYALYNVPALTKDGRILAVVIAIVVLIMAVVIVWLLGNSGGAPDAAYNRTYLGNKSISIGVGGGLGIIMLLNVWGIIWRVQKRAIAAMQGNGTAPAPEEVRKAFLASRTNAWLSLPMLFLMGTSHGDWVLFGK